MAPVNLVAPMGLTRLVVPAMLERRTGSVVHVASLAGKVPLPYFAMHTATKYGVVGRFAPSSHCGPWRRGPRRSISRRRMRSGSGCRRSAAARTAAAWPRATLPTARSGAPSS
ncbi:MAG: SDR family NAD(P)-dependent oxidoreductase [Gemmatimonadaceae bacterium]|nr:SDR family NAD(P)-dependent oxidoreductase [Gemmatimonadaceae bacterium]